MENTSEIREDYDENRSHQEERDADMETEYTSWELFEAIWKDKHPVIAEYKTIWRCLQFCTLFPHQYEFCKDDMIGLWISAEMEDDDACLFFEELESMGIFLWSSLDSRTGLTRYKLNNSIFKLLEQQHDHAYVRVEDYSDVVIRSTVLKNILHLSVYDSSIEQITLERIYQAKLLRTLLLIHGHGSQINIVPREVFLKLPLLRVLDLSCTNITVVPSSVGNLKELRYINLSGTPISTLPNSLCNLYQLRLLKLRGCRKLVGLPKGMRKLINLRQVDVDVAHLMGSMPPGFGDLIRLRKLPAFVVGKDEGCHITELRYMENLCGTFRILRLENVSSGTEAVDAAMDKKICIDRLLLQWTEFQDGFHFEVLQNLRPHTQLEELQIVGFTSSEFPSWIADPLFSKLVTITLHDCRKCKLLPPLGKLPSLKRLFISDMHAVKTIDARFCGRDMVAGLLDLGRLLAKTVSHRFKYDNMFKGFQQLENLTLNAMPMLEKWTGMEKGEFHQLKKLNISCCPSLAAIPKLSILKSLQHLEISLCPLLTFLPSNGIPTSLRYLAIIDCPLLKEWCEKDAMQNWKMLAHVPKIWINYEQITQDEEIETKDEINVEGTKNDNAETSTVDQIASGKIKRMEEQEMITKVSGERGEYTTNEVKDRSSSSCGKLSSMCVPRATSQYESDISQSSKLKRFGFKELKKATNNFSSECKIGEGSISSVYKGWIDENNLTSTKPGTGSVVAVKWFRKGVQGQKEWLAEINYLGQLNHRNLVRLVGYCMKDDHLLLVLEYIERGSLGYYLFKRHINAEPLSWSLRMNVALGTAKGLAYLNCINQYVYGHFKTSDILLDSNYNAKLSVPVHRPTYVRSETYGYAAPECIAAGHYSAKSDVYSFGVVLLEIITGIRALGASRPALGSSGPEQTNLEDFVKPFLNQKKLPEVIDKSLGKNYSVSDALQVAILASQCISPGPNSRPTMNAVVEALEQLQSSKGL